MFYMIDFTQALNFIYPSLVLLLLTIIDTKKHGNKIWVQTLTTKYAHSQKHQLNRFTARVCKTIPIIYSTFLAGKADHPILTQLPIVIASC